MESCAADGFSVVVVERMSSEESKFEAAEAKGRVERRGVSSKGTHQRLYISFRRTLTWLQLSEIL